MREQSRHLLVRLHFRPARRAIRQVRLEGDAIGFIERIEGVGRRVLRPGVFVTHSANSYGARLARSLVRAVRTRVFTVPSGSFNAAAISLWDIPLKNASSMTLRWFSGKVARVWFTRARSSDCSAFLSGSSPSDAIGSALPSFSGVDCTAFSRSCPRRLLDRNRSNARVRVIIDSQAGTLARAGSKDAALLHACTKASVTTSSASAPVLKI